MRSELINPYIRRAKRSTLVAGTVIKQRVIFDYELIYVEEGNFTLRYDGRDHSCRKGDILLLRPGVAHSFGGLRADVSQPHIHFDLYYEPDSERVEVSFKDRGQMSGEERALIREDAFRSFPQEPRLYIRDREAFLERFFRIVTPGGTASALERKALMLQLLDAVIADNFYREEQTAAEGHRATPALIKEYIDSAYDTAITLESLEKQFYYNRYYLERQFLKMYGMPVMSYRNRLRIGRAKELLREHTVTETAALLSYSSVFAFSRAFKRETGKSPSEWRGR